MQCGNEVVVCKVMELNTFILFITVFVNYHLKVFEKVAVKSVFTKFLLFIRRQNVCSLQSCVTLTNVGTLGKMFGSRLSDIFSCSCRLSLHFSGHFPGEPTWVNQYQCVSILDIIGAKADGGGCDNWSYNKTYKAPVKTSPPTNQHPACFYRPDALPVAQPTVSEQFLYFSMLHHGLSLKTGVEWVCCL